jgi:indolepyruvate decarboxylase
LSESVIQYVLRRLREIGVDAVFGVPGDFAFPVHDAIVATDGLEWVGCSNELNAGYAADGYARLRGVAALNTTYGVGELSALNAIAGSYAENLPVFHLTGMPAMPVQGARSLVHHTLGDGEFGLFHRMAEPVVCGSAIMTPQNVAYETERLIAAALYHRRPVYLAFPADLADAPVLGHAHELAPPQSDPQSLAGAVDAVLAALADADTACVLPGILAARLQLRQAVADFVDASGLPFATMFADKTVLDESHPRHLGMYDGKLANEQLRMFVESCDRVLRIGAVMTDFNSGAFTARLDPARTIDIGRNVTRVGTDTFTSVEMGDVLAALTQRVTPRQPGVTPEPSTIGPLVGAGDDPITEAALYPRWERFFAPGDTVIAETGTASMGLAFARLPAGATFHNQTLWGSIGWATPAAFGAAVAGPPGRVILITGEGSHQLTAQEVGQFGRRGLEPIIFVLNNDGYLIERLLAKDPEAAYNDVAAWNYTALPHALGCRDWYTARVSTCGELDDALATARSHRGGVYIEVVTDRYAAPPLAQRLHDNVASLYGS